MKKNLTPFKGHIDKSKRKKLMGHSSYVLWLTGLSGSGKSTIAHELEKILFEKGIHSYVLDGDNIRAGLNKDLDFSKNQRKENIRRIGEVARLFVDAGIVVIPAFISPFKADRENVKKICKKGEFFEIYIKCSFSECQKRDPKGLYKKVAEKKIDKFTGVSSPYEEPEKPDLVIDTTVLSVPHSVDKIIQFLHKKKLLP